MRKKQIFIYIALFIVAILAMLGIAYGVRQAIRAGNLAGIDWYDVNGTEFVISTEEELYEFETLSNYYDFAGQTVKLGADIVVNEGNAEDWLKEAPAKKWQPIMEFAGTFDGQGHSISGLYGKSSTMSMGLFSETKEGCVIQDVKILNSLFSNTTNSGLGSVMGEGTGTIKYVYSNAILYGEGESNGGIAGLIKDKLTIQECWFDGQVIATQRSNGGMIGWVDRKADVLIENCLNTGLLKCTLEGGSKTGGFVGGISDIAYRTDVSMVTIKDSLTTGEIDVVNTGTTGAAVGINRQNGALTFNNAYAVISTENAAGELTIGTNNGALTGNAVPRFRDTLLGVGGYQWTNLDFENYWSCVEGDTPILKYFADDALDLTGVEKAVDTSWYKEGQTEFVLEDLADLWGFAMLSANTSFEGVTIKLGADIVINDSDSETWEKKAPKYNWFPIYSFSGIFDGQGHTISGLYSVSNLKVLGLFEKVNATSSLMNLKLTNSYIKAAYCVGSFAGQGGGTLSNLYSDATVISTTDMAGGIIGAINQIGAINNCWFDGYVHAEERYVGGITGSLQSSTANMAHCLNTGTVYSGTRHTVGGLVGIVISDVTMADCLSAGTVIAQEGCTRVGAAIGHINTDKLILNGVYATRDGFEQDLSVGQGYPGAGAVFMNTTKELTGTNAYKYTRLNFDKYWTIDKEGTPILQTFADEIIEMPKNVARPVIPDTSWFDEDKTTFTINTVEELYGFAMLTGQNDFEGKTVRLGKNIKINSGNADNWDKTTPVNQWASIYNFNGTFDGRGKTISGIFVRDGQWRVGLFGNTLENAVVKNVKVTNSHIEGAYHLGAIIGWMEDSTIEGVYSDANIVARSGHGGGLVGTVVESEVNNAWFDGTLVGHGNYIGGITSFVSVTSDEDTKGSTLSNCLNTGSITGVSNVGGIAGRTATKTTIKYSLNAGTVTGVANAGAVVGVVVAETNCDIAEGVYATAESTKKSVGNGGGSGAVIMLPEAELSGDKAYQRTILDFNKYWGVVAKDTPILKKFGGKAPSNTDVKRATKPDTSWYSAKKKTFVLKDYADLYGLAVLSADTDFKGKTIKLGKNIVANSGNAEDFATNIPLNQLVPISNFAGTFDGQGKTISGLSANNGSAWYVGLFGKTAEGATIKNIDITNSYLSGEYHIGSVVGSGNSVKIENVYSDTIIEATQGHVGGIVGSLSGKSSVSNCWYDGSATGANSYIGGITSFVGDLAEVTVSHCLNTAPMKGRSNVAGLVGRVAGELTLKDSLNTALINGMGASGSVVGLITENGKVTFDAAYGTKESAGNVVGNGTNYTGDAQLLNEVYLQDQSGYTLTNLDFDKYWTALDGETPQLSYFEDKITADEVSLKGVDHMDTSWYNAKKNTYVLKDRADLYGFSYLLNSGNTFAGKTVTLGKNIKVNDGAAADWANGEEPLYKWMPIGSYEGHTNYTKSFAGTFDGKMYSISGLYTKNEGNANKMYNWCAGLFGRTNEGAVVKNVEVLNSYFESPYYNGVVGSATGTTIDTVYSNAIVNATAGNSGGIAGAMTGGNVNNAWFDGSITNVGQFTGGIVGVINDKVTVSNCLTTGTLQSTATSNNNYIGGLVGGVNGQALVTDSLSVPKSIVANTGHCIGSVIGGVGKEAKATATNTYTLDGISKLTIGQQIKTEEIGVAVNRISTCSDLTGLNGYSLTKLDFAQYWVALADTTPELMSFSDGTALAVDTSFRSSTEWYTEAEADPEGNEPGTEENPYILYNKVDLYGFAELVNSGTTFAGEHVQLGADIVVNVTDASTWASSAPDYAWEPIGSYENHGDYSKAFAGTFDGKDPETGDIYSISGLYTKKTGADNNMNSWCAGLFGRTAEGASVKNVKVLNSYFEGNTNNGVIGHATGTTIENIYSDAIIVTTGTQNGGIVGALSGGSVDGAWFAGTITSEGQFVGGIVGLASGDASINNSLTTGTVKSTYTGTNAYAGGLVGCASGNMSLTNSVSAAKEVTATGKRAGAAFGSANAGTVTVTMDEVYVIAGVHKFAVGENATGTYTEHPWVMPTLNGYNGYTLTKLDFNDTWLALEGTSPELAVFSEGTALNVADSFRPKTTWAGTGTETDPYVISTKEELYGLAEMVNNGTTFEGQYIVLGADITVNEGNAAHWATSAPAQAWTPIGYYNVRTKLAQHFMGTFDGKMHTISGLYMNASKDDVNIGGLFVDTDACTIKNLKLVNSYISAVEGTAAIAGWNNGGIFDTIYTDAIVKSNKNNSAGIVALINEADSTITNCWFDGELTAKKYVGGIVAYATGGTGLEISHCLNTGKITSLHVQDKDGTRSYAAGIVGDANTTITITDCLSAGDAITVQDGMTYYGSIAGRVKIDSTINNVYALLSTCEYACWETAANNKCSIFDELNGEDAYLSTNLDFDNYWVVKKDSTPELKSFVAAGDTNVLDVNAWFNNAQGTQANPYVLSTKSELYSFAKKVNAGNTFEGKYVTLGADITVNTGDAATWATTAPEYSWTPIGTSTNPFKGNFNATGEMHEISGLYAVRSADASRPTWYNGLFGYTDGATIGNLKVANSYFQAANYAGVVGYANASTIDTVYSSVIVNISENGGSAGGGIVGQMAGEGSINNCWFDGQIASKGRYLGGILGIDNGTASIAHCLVTGSISTTCTSSNVYTGGLLGLARTDVKISDCLVAAKNIQSTKTGCYGSVIGSINDGTRPAYVTTVENVYALDSIGNTTATVGRTAYGGGTMSGAPVECTNIIGEAAYLSTNLDFDNHWVLVKDKMPALKCFADANVEAITLGQWFTAADGSESNPYVLNTATDLYEFSKKVKAGNKFTGKYVVLGADITVNDGDAADWATNAPAFSWIPIGTNGMAFEGYFNTTGEIREIKGLYTNMSTTDFVGFFGALNNATVENVKITNSYFSGSRWVGGVAGYIVKSTVDTAYSNAHVVAAGANAGGIVGNMCGGTIQNCWFDGTVTGKGDAQYAGGIVGKISDVSNNTVNNCLATGTVKGGKKTGNAYTGGIIGGVSKKAATMSNCLSVVKSVEASGTTACVGSVIGGIDQTTVTVTNAYVVKGINNDVTIGTGAAGSVATAQPVICDDLTGENAALHTALDFENVWVMIKDSTPVLKNFKDVSDANIIAIDAWYKEATGTKTDPYVINTATELNYLATLVNSGQDDFAGKYIVLGRNITINSGSPADGWETTAPAYKWNPIGTSIANTFKGNFNGLGEIREIKGLYVNTGSGNFAGLFGSVTNGTVKNIKLTDSYIQGNQFVGAIAGFVNKATIDTVYTNATVVGTTTAGTVQVGGVVGYQVAGTVKNAWFDGAVTGVNSSQYVGGVVGRTTDSNGAVIDNCLATGTVTSGRTSGNAYAGGILGGATRNTTVSNCLSALKSPLTVNGATGCIGSVVGGSGTANYTLTVKNCYAASGVASKANGTGGAGTLTGTSTVLTAYTGADGYSNTQLVFDRPETTDVVEGPWVARKDACPGLKSFTAEADVYDITGLFAANTAWANSPVVQNIDGVDTNTYTITRPEQLIGLASLVNAGTKNFDNEVIYLDGDITFNTGNAADWATKAPAYSWIAIGSSANPFKGSFNTNGEIREISGLYAVNSADARPTWYNGLFGYVDGAVIQNLKVTNSYIAAANYAGVVGYANASTIDTVYSSVIVNISENGGSAGGGIVGQMAGEGSINNCWFDGQIASKGRYLGGILGIDNGTASIAHCLVTGSISTTCTSSNVYTGGLLGLARTDVKISDCLVAAKNIQSTKTGCYGSVIGSINDMNKTANPFVVTVDSVYALDNIGNTTVTVGRTSHQGGSMSGAPAEKTVQELQTGYATLLNADYWMVDTAKSETPILKSFAN